MTETRTIECDGCGKELKIEQDDLHSWLNLQGGIYYQGKKPRHLCDGCATFVYDQIALRRTSQKSKQGTDIFDKTLQDIKQMNKK